MVVGGGVGGMGGIFAFAGRINAKHNTTSAEQRNQKDRTLSSWRTDDAERPRGGDDPPGGPGAP